MIMGNILCLGTKLLPPTCSRSMSALTKVEIKERKNQLFNEEKKRQQDAVGRLEKIEVKYSTALEEVTLVMNKNVSTPHHCARHISEGTANVSALASVDGHLWDMHRPLISDCELQLLHLKSPENVAVNYAFWRTCSLMLGSMASDAFKDDVDVHLHSFPKPNVKSGSFVCDVYLSLPEWQPTDAELRAMSAEFVKLVQAELPVERLEVTESLALEIFQDNPFKVKQIPDIAEHYKTITLYRIGDHIDISRGPMVGNTNLVGRATVTAVHKIQSDDVECLYRFQGVALPHGIRLNHYAYKILEDRAKKLNSSMWVPQKLGEESNDRVAIAVKN
ncbi:39S ribosomal protein L39, mitochondrial isoform X2 [Orussus abietinus]|uniref:39S ribosomal protein L39, mitochondrial isoform X2 n=1 Tax=Orussus abietinus TaxID=222816 RepID=UPI00062654CE|nr:39S ribosomal protein L39, mitochondrial isoform X2 [Orussus abietinus]